MAKPRTSYSHRLLVMCEGHEDHRFLCRLMEVRNLPPFHIQTASTDKRGGGNTEFGRVLRVNSKNNRGFSQIHNVLIVTDSDGDKAATFARICQQLQDAGFVPPLAPLQPGPPLPAITVMVLDGNLECYLRAAATNADAMLAATVDQFEALVTKDQWPPHRAGKLWLRSSLAARCERDPFVTLGSVFTDARFHNLVPLNDPSFNPLEDLLRSLA